jgi:CheY-like chemotaxis protein
MKEFKDLNILLAEDNFINQKIALLTFAKTGVSIDVASNGKQAVEMYKGKTYDLILMDLQMPVMDGVEATRQIRNVEKESSHRAYIIALTASTLYEKKDECLQAGMDNIMEKPLQENVLRELISKID